MNSRMKEVIRRMKENKDLKVEEDGLDFGELYIVLDIYVVTVNMKKDIKELFKIDRLKEDEVDLNRMNVDTFGRIYGEDIYLGKLKDIEE